MQLKLNLHCTFQILVHNIPPSRIFRTFVIPCIDSVIKHEQHSSTSVTSTSLY